ncbi:hypothetical protein Runsl_0167 [Runella slithyformis DSM 19594]|uniref:Uncharacterized protein n=1 Tax=Runella slithyformis (strain ATCC 29530 / DSM 19594 / LMG 11500 / NCIMB 11436 / LSU 4) TaxID=761193 RepID=A0A7U3ZG61_RUNSL|nr:hypothetical protein Runsl_0167 [Runella slithyformis DSM 19594]
MGRNFQFFFTVRSEAESGQTQGLSLQYPFTFKIYNSAVFRFNNLRADASRRRAGLPLQYRPLLHLKFIIFRFFGSMTCLYRWHRLRHSSFNLARSSSVKFVHFSRQGGPPGILFSPRQRALPPMEPRPKLPNRIRHNTSRPTACQNEMRLTPNKGGRIAFQSHLTIAPNANAAAAAKKGKSQKRGLSLRDLFIFFLIYRSTSIKKRRSYASVKS